MNTTSAQTAPSPDNDNVIELTDGPGRRLRQARQSRGLQVEQVATQLHLAPRQISALERDDYEALPGPVFIAGYMRNYARLLGLDPEPLLEAYRAATPAMRPQPSSARPAAPSQVTGGHRSVGLVSVAVIAALGALAFIWWKNQTANDPVPQLAAEEAAADVAIVTSPDVALATVTQVEPGPDEVPPAPYRLSPEPVPTVALEAVPEQPAPQAPIVAVAAATDDAESATEVTADAVAAQEGEVVESAPTVQAGEENGDAPPASGEIVMSFSGPCWVDIRDKDRKFKLFGEMAEGDRHVLEGEPPYSVILGNAAAVEITVAGVPYDIDGFVRGNVARFSLDPDQLP